MIEPERDHIFISYAWEDGALAEWLVRKLTADGYRVWCDRFKILGGEHWPKDIDRAIKERTFRMLGLLSEYSLEKPNPSKERQMALALSKARNEDFLIPLNVDGRDPIQLGWELSDLSYIPFESWSAGLAQLLEKLESINAPRPIAASGARVAAETFLPKNVLVDEDEPLFSNCLMASFLPKCVNRYSLSRKLAQFEKQKLELGWAFYLIDDAHALAFTAPDPLVLNESVPECEVDHVDATPLAENSQVHGISSKHLTSTLVKKSLLLKCFQRGLVPSRDGKAAFFPNGLLPKDAISYRNYNGKRTHVGVVGERKLGKGRFRYQLGVSFWVRSDVLDLLVAETKIQLLITDPSGAQLDGHAANARRKKVAKSWWNHEWLSRQLAITEFLRDGQSNIQIGLVPEESVHFAGRMLEGRGRPRINDQALEPLAKKVRAMTQSLSDDEAEQEASEQIAAAKDVA